MSPTQASIHAAIQALQAGRMVVLVDDEDRENEGDLVLAAEKVTPEAVNFMAMHARGLICLSLEADRVDALGLSMMAPKNGSPRGTAFTVSIEARTGVSTGISAADRAHTIRVAANPESGADALVSPGHIFPLRAQTGGVLVRAGHTEGSIDLVKLAGLQPSAVICEVMNDDGTMARLSDLRRFSEKHGIPIVAIKDVIAHRMQQERLVERVATTRFPTMFAGGTEFQLHAYRDLHAQNLQTADATEHIALTLGDPGSFENDAPGTLVRVHSECLTGDALGSLRCDCGPQLQSALARIAKEGRGVLIYMRKHEGRGIGLVNKIKAYSLQDQGLDTVEANRHLGFGEDLRHYGLGAQILKDLGVRKIRLLTNNPRKIVGLDGYGLEIVERLPLEVGANPHNEAYLRTKQQKLGHTLERS